MASPATLLANEYAGFSLDVSKELLTQYSTLLKYKEHNEKLVGLLSRHNDKLKLSIRDFKDLNKNYKGQINILEIKITNDEDKFGFCEDRAEKWKLEYGQCSEDLTKALKKPWYYIHLPSTGYGAILVLALMII